MDVTLARLRAVSLGALLAPAVFLAACQKKAETVVETFPETKAECAATAVPNRYLVHWKDGRTSIEYAKDRATLIQKLIEPHLEKIEFAEQDQVVSLIEPGQISADEQASTSPSWGQEIIEVSAAWERGIEGQGVLVAVIDSGADTLHPQLAPNMARNEGEIAGNGIDDDQNGYTDDVFGYDFYRKYGVVSDMWSGHGTHVSGIIAADHTQGSVLGVAPKAKVIPLAFMGKDGSGSLGDAILAMKYAATRGARVVNASWGGAPCSDSLRRAIQELEAQGILFVSAAGNDGIDLDVYPSYPAAYGLSGQLTVGASTARDYTGSFSNYSFNLVNIVAPGSEILSTYPGGKTVSFSGTSMAAPFVSAAAALLWSHRPQASLQDIRSAILKSVDPGGFAASSRGRLNIRKAVAELEASVP